MKKFFTYVLFIVLLLSGCKRAIEPNTVPTENAFTLGNEPVEIEFWHCASDHAGTLVEQYVKEFNQNNPYKITVHPVYQGQYADASTLMKTLISAENFKELPDVMQIDATGKVDYLNSGRAFTADAAQALYGDNIFDDYVPIAMANWQYGGKQLGLPFGTSTTITFYNKDLLARAGWDHCPETFMDLIQLSQDMKAAGIETPSFGTVPNTPMLANWLGQMGSYLVDQANGSEGTATKMDCIENKALEHFLEAWKELYDAGAVVNNSLSSNDFVTGNVALYTSSSSGVFNILNKVGDSFEVGVGPFLRVRSDADSGATVSGSCLALFDSQNEAKKAAAWEFVKYMTSAEIQADYAIGTGYMPGIKAAADDPKYKEFIAAQPQFAAAAEQLAQTPAFMRSVTVGPAVDIYNQIMNIISEMLEKGQSPADAAAEMQNSLEAILARVIQ